MALMAHTQRSWRRHIRGTSPSLIFAFSIYLLVLIAAPEEPDLECVDETKARDTQKFSERVATNIRPEKELPERTRRDIDQFLRITFPSLNLTHRRVLTQAMLSFLQTDVQEPKTAPILYVDQQGRAILACTYFLAWLAARVEDCFDLRCAALALERAIKDNEHHPFPDLALV